MDWEDLTPYVPTDHARQVRSAYYIESLMSQDPPPTTVVDLGCGVGTSLNLFRGMRQDVQWIGIDIPDSMEAVARPNLDGPVVLYDGVRIPLKNDAIDVVYSHQVFEHVRYPEELLREITRILCVGGYFAGSTSQLEPYHSRSYWNYTVPGFCTLLLDAGMEVCEVRPSIDGVTLIQRAYTGRRSEFGKWFNEESPINREVDEWAARTGRGPGAANNRKLRFCGHFCFLAQKAS